MSPKWSINANDVKASVRALSIAYVPVLLVVLDAIQKGQYDAKALANIWAAAALSVTIDLLRRCLRGPEQGPMENTSDKS